MVQRLARWWRRLRGIHEDCSPIVDLLDFDKDCTDVVPLPKSWDFSVDCAIGLVYGAPYGKSWRIELFPDGHTILAVIEFEYEPHLLRRYHGRVSLQKIDRLTGFVKEVQFNLLQDEYDDGFEGSDTAIFQVRAPTWRKRVRVHSPHLWQVSRGLCWLPELWNGILSCAPIQPPGAKKYRTNH